MTAPDWRIHATAANQQKFADAQARLDEGDYPPGEPGHALRREDQRFTDWYDQAVNAASWDELERQGEIADFQQRWPEPADGARIEFEADRGKVYGAYRENDPDHEQIEARWYLYGSDEAWTWPDLVFRFQLPEHLDDVTVLVDARAACDALDVIVSDYPDIPTACAAGVEGDFQAWTMTPNATKETNR